MPSKIGRKKFLQLSLLAPLSFTTKPLALLCPEQQGLVSALSNNENVSYIKASDAEYDLLRKGFNKRINTFPAVIALCKNSEGVAEAIQYAAKNNLPVAIKSGGHCMEGFSGNNNGLVINLSAMKNITWLGNDKVMVNPGCTLSELYDALLPKKKIIPGGSCAGVGIGGLTLGGGYGLMARQFGLTCDSLHAVTMVDGTGKIIDSSTDNELLWACKGGNNGNFGVVTSLTFQVHNAPAYMQSFRFKTYQLNSRKAKELLQHWFSLTENLPLSCFSAFVLNGKTAYILLTNTGKLNQALQLIIDRLKAATEKYTQTSRQPLSKALKVYYGRTQPLFFKNASAGLYKNFTDIESFIEEAIEVVLSAPGMIYQVNTLGGNIQNAEFKNNSAFPHRDYPYFSELQTYWESPKQEKKLLEKFQQVQEIFSAHHTKAQYRNYPDINFSNWPELYYGSNYKRLQEIKNRYDPKNVFRYEQSIKNL